VIGCEASGRATAARDHRRDKRRTRRLSDIGRLRFANRGPVGWFRSQDPKVRHEAHRCRRRRHPRGAGRACLRGRPMPWLKRWPATPLRRRLHAARLRGDGLSRAALVSLSGIVSRGLDQPAPASRPPCLEEAGLWGENAGLYREAHVRIPGFAPELTCRRPATPIQNISGLPQGLVRRRGGRVIVRRSLHLFAPKEVHHERAGPTAVAHSRRRGSRALFGRLPRRRVSVGVRPSLVLTPSATADVEHT
jgi:hypothetical protein